MSSNRVPAKQNTRVHNAHLRQVCSQWTSIIPVLVLALGLGGCALNSAGLPGGLPVPPGGGTLTISRSTLMAGITGRTYTIWIPTSGGTGTLAPGGCALIGGGSLPAGLTIARSDDLPANAALSFCKITGTITTAGPATVTFTLQASDTATPANTASQSLSIVVRPEFAVTTATPFLNGVIGRTYGNAPQAPQPVVTNVSATVGNAPLNAVGGCVFTIAGNPGFNLTPAATGGNTCPLSSGATALTASGPFSVSLAATDSDLTDTFAGQITKIVVPRATKNSAALALTVNVALGVTLTQSTNATPTTALLNAVQGRNYGTGAQAAGAPSYAATGGLTTTGNYNWCVSTGALPAGFTTSPSAVAACPTTAAVAVATPVTVTAATAGAAGGPTGFTLLAGDTGNAAVPALTTAATVGAVSNTVATNLTINGLLALAVNLANALPDAVLGRTYGGAGFTSIVYTASFGAGAYTFTAPPTAGAPGAGVFPTPMACVSATPTLTCSSAAITGTAGAYTNAPASVNDAGNAAVPGSAAASATATVTRSLTVRPEFTITTVAAFLPGVQGRTYGNPLAPDLKTPQPVNTNVSATVGNAPLTTCTFVVAASNPGFNLAPAPAGTACNLSSGATALGAANAYTVSLSVQDSPITDPVSTGTVVPAGTVTNVAPLALTVSPILSLTLAQATNGAPLTALLNAVQARSYGVIGGTPTYTPGGGLSGTVNYDWCIFAGSLPSGFAANPSALSACPTTVALPVATAVTVTAATVGAAGGPTGFTLQVSDGGNAAVSAGTATQGTALTINPLLSMAANFNNPMPDAVFGRTYGGVGFTSLVYTVGLNSGVGAYTFIAPPTAGAPAAGVFPTPMSCASAATTLTCSSGSITGAAGAYTNAPASVNDAGNTAVPGSAAASATATVTRSLTVRAEFTITTVAAFLPGVQGRTYGNPGAPDNKTPQPVNTDVSATVGNAPLTTCTFAVAGNPGFNLAPAPAGTACNLSSGATTLSAAGGFNVSLSVQDTAITDPVSTGTVVPAGTVTNSGTPLALTVNALLSIALRALPLPASPDPTTPAGHAVIGRTYGKAPQAPVDYVVSGGLTTYTINTSGTLLTDTNIACPAGATTVTCSQTAGGVTKSTAGTSAGLTISVTDSFNSATVAVSAPVTVAPTFTIWPAITFSLVPGATGGVPNGAIPDGVVGRQYGTPLGANDLVFTASGGLANTVGLTGTASGTFVGSIPASNSGLVCAPAGPQVGASVSVTCNSGGGASTLGGTATAKTLVMTFSDAGNSTTPLGSTNTDSTGYNNYSNTMAAALAIALQGGSPDPANVNARAVVGRTYGAAPQAPVVYEASGGLPGYTITRSGLLVGPPANSNICLVPVSTATTLACNSGGVGATGSTAALTVSVSDTANATTPSGLDSLLKTYTINPAVTMSIAPDPASASSTAVIGRAYGVPAGLLSPTYTASNGLGLYSFTVGAPGAGITCVTGATTVVCDSGAVAAGPAAFDVTVKDDVGGTSLTTEPDLTGVTINRKFLVNPALTITTATLPNGLRDFTYSPSGGPGVTLQSSGGLGAGGNTWVPGGSTVGLCSPTATTVFPPGLTLVPSSGLLFGVPSTISAVASDYTFQVCVFDTANATTPSGIPAALPTYTVNVLDTLAYTANSGNDTVSKLNTTSNASPATSIPLTGSDQPFGVAVTPDGRKVYVTATGNNAVRVIDTITGAVTSVTPNLGACTGPQGIAIRVGPPALAFVACSNRRIAVINASTDTFVSAGNYGSVGATFYGVAITPDDAFVYVTDSTNNKIVVLDASSAVEISGSPFGAGVTTPHGVAISADGNRVYIAGSFSNDVIVLGTGNNRTIAAVNGAVRATSVVTITTTVDHGFAVGRTVIIAGVTDASFNGTFVIASTPTTTTFTYAQVVADASSGGGTATLVVAGPISTGLGSSPEALAVTPAALGAHVYVTLQGTDAFAVFDDTLATPALTPAPAPIVAGTGAVRATGVVTITTTVAHGLAVGPPAGQAVIIAGVTDASFNGTFVITSIPTTTTFAYAQVAADATSGSGTANFVGDLTGGVPWGVTIPPLLTVPFRVYIAQFGPDNVAIRDDETVTPFGVNGASPVALTPPATPNPKGIAHIPVPR